MVLRNTGCGGVLRVFGYVHSEKETRGRLPARTQPLDAGLTNQAQAGAGSGAQWKKHALPLNYPDRSSSALGSQGLPFQRTSTGYPMRCDVCSPCALAIGVRSLTKFRSRPLTTRTYEMRMCTDATALSRRGETVHPGGACPVVRGDPCVCELCCVGQIACALPVWLVVLGMLSLYAVGGTERCSQGERGARA